MILVAAIFLELMSQPQKKNTLDSKARQGGIVGGARIHVPAVSTRELFVWKAGVPENEVYIRAWNVWPFWWKTSWWRITSEGYHFFHTNPCQEHTRTYMSRVCRLLSTFKQGLVNVQIKHHPTIGDIISSTHLKVMWNLFPKVGTFTNNCWDSYGQLPAVIPFIEYTIP